MAGCETKSSFDAPLIDPVSMIAQNTSIWRRFIFMVINVMLMVPDKKA